MKVLVEWTKWIQNPSPVAFRMTGWWMRFLWCLSGDHSALVWSRLVGYTWLKPHLWNLLQRSPLATAIWNQFGLQHFRPRALLAVWLWGAALHSQQTSFQLQKRSPFSNWLFQDFLEGLKGLLSTFQRFILLQSFNSLLSTPFKSTMTAAQSSMFDLLYPIQRRALNHSLLFVLSFCRVSHCLHLQLGFLYLSIPL